MKPRTGGSKRALGVRIRTGSTLPSPAGRSRRRRHPCEVETMNDIDRFKLLGNYRTPRFKYGDVVACEIRGDVKSVGLTDARIPWPKCRSGKCARAIALYGDLV